MSTPFWLDEQTPAVPARSLDGPPDVEIVGAGVTGCSCALVLARAGRRVRVHDARQVAEGASGRNGGFVLRGGAARYDVARETYGAEASKELWLRTEAMLDRMEAVADGALRRVGSLRLAADEEERDDIRAEYEALREDDFDAEWRDDLPPGLAEHFQGAIFHPRDGAVQPARLVRRLAAMAAEAGAEIREGSRVDALEQLEAADVVIATDGSGAACCRSSTSGSGLRAARSWRRSRCRSSCSTIRTTPGRASITGNSFRTAGSSSAGSATSRSCPS